LYAARGTKIQVTADEVKVRYSFSWAGLRAWFYQKYVCSHPHSSQKVSTLVTIKGNRSIQLCQACGWARMSPSHPVDIAKDLAKEIYEPLGYEIDEGSFKKAKNSLNRRSNDND